jgi:HAD superfamily hydrolase (TIGR01509 family)
MKNIVFDLAEVVFTRLNRFPKELEEYFSFVYDPREGVMLKFWVEFDRGLRTIDQVAEAVAECCNDTLEAAKRKTMLSITYYDEIKATAELIAELKEKGYRVIILSNMSKEYIEYLRQKPVYRLIDEDLISCEVGFVKPERAMYELLLERFGLDASQTMFIDDRKHNVDAAAELGITPYQFDNLNPEASCNAIREIIGLPKKQL